MPESNGFAASGSEDWWTRIGTTPASRLAPWPIAGLLAQAPSVWDAGSSEKLDLLRRVVAETEAVERGISYLEGHGWTSNRPDSRVVFEVLEGMLLCPSTPLDLDILNRLHKVVKSRRYARHQHDVHLPAFAMAVARHAGAAACREPWNAMIRSTAMLLDSSNGDWNREVPMLLYRLIDEIPPSGMRAGDVWTNDALATIQSAPRDRATAIHNLLSHCGDRGAKAGTKKWRTHCRELVAQVGQGDCEKHIERWFKLANSPRQSIATDLYSRPLHPMQMIASNLDVLIGLVRIAGMLESASTARALSDLVVSAFRKIPGVGQRAIRLGTAAIQTLGGMRCDEALMQLSVLRTRVTFRTGQHQLRKAIGAQALFRNMPEEDVDELAVPTYGWSEVGHGVEAVGDCQACLTVEDTSRVELAWIDANAKVRKSPPASIARTHVDRVKEIKGRLKDLKRILAAQRDRIERMYLRSKSWNFETWALRYLRHPVVGVVSQRLVWQFDSPNDSITAAWLNGRLVDNHEQAVFPPADAQVSLWHPIDASAEEVAAWRRFFEANRIRQPFKQAHREIYLITDPERTTEVYSNRFASHILRQRSYHALCELRGWRDKLRLRVDAEYEATNLPIPDHHIRAELWVQGIDEIVIPGGGDVGFDCLATDQVRFYPIMAPQLSAHSFGGGYRAFTALPDPIPLDRIPRRVFSEVFRDIDLFVGVSSVGNDPRWGDAGREPAQHAYWQQYAFGDPGASAEIRHDLLSRLLPKLSIADRCRLTAKFLEVRGDLRTYEIHLRSGHIKMQPGDVYLCIVAAPRARTEGDSHLFLPFDGDGTLSEIISKAFLLAADAQITDQTILRQIHRR